MILRRLPLVLAACATLLLVGCGFHLRRSAALPEAMQRVYLEVSGGGDLPRELRLAVRLSGATVEDAPGPGIATLEVPVAAFRTDALTVSGFARITEYAVRYHVEFDVKDADGKPVVARQVIDMSREYTFDRNEVVGNEAQQEEIRRGLTRDMVQAIMRRLEAARLHPEAVLQPESSAAPQDDSDGGPSPR